MMKTPKKVGYYRFKFWPYDAAADRSSTEYVAAALLEGLSGILSEIDLFVSTRCSYDVTASLQHTHQFRCGGRCWSRNNAK